MMGEEWSTAGTYLDVGQQDNKEVPHDMFRNKGCATVLVVGRRFMHTYGHGVPPPFNGPIVS